jgi:glyoxylase-like metal-dependent hydrolase (beta-lactamase superfamily II)
MRQSLIRLVFILCLAQTALAAQADVYESVRVADGVYAFIGETGPRTVANEGMNANFGLVVTRDGALLIDSGSSMQTARKLHEAAARVTSQPIKWVVNLGGQGHSWMGNGYFKALGAEIIAHASARDDYEQRGHDHARTILSLMQTQAQGTQPVLPTRWLNEADTQLELGGVTFEFKHRGGAHTPGDMLLWLPQHNVLFSGNVVFTDRMLDVITVTNTKHWLDTFAVIDALAPHTIVPGHGRVCELATARAHTRDYLAALRQHMKHAVDAGLDISTASRQFDASRWRHLELADELLPINASNVYLEIEQD